MKYMLIIGNPTHGFEYVGPFDSGDDAAEYMYRVGDRLADWWVGVLDAPSAQEDGGLL